MVRINSLFYVNMPRIQKFIVGDKDLISQHFCYVTIMPDGEHWFHTPEQLAFLKAWEEKVVFISHS
jgi:hypothetical protein